VGAGKVFVHGTPVLALFGEDMSAAPTDFVTSAELHGPVKRGDGNSTIHGHVRLFDVVGEFGRALQIVVKRLAESAEPANPFVLRGREAHEAAVKHLQRGSQIAGVDGASLCTFELKDLLTDALWHGTPPVVGGGRSVPKSDITPNRERERVRDIVELILNESEGEERFLTSASRPPRRSDAGRKSVGLLRSE
jgi:hypothetical protein